MFSRLNWYSVTGIQVADCPVLGEDAKYRIAGTMYINPIAAAQSSLSRAMSGIKIKGIARISMIMAPTRGFLSATNLAIKRGPPMSSPHNS
jgi:hypothetical protein